MKPSEALHRHREEIVRIAEPVFARASILRLTLLKRKRLYGKPRKAFIHILVAEAGLEPA